MRLFHTVLVVALCLVFSASVPASQDIQTPQGIVKPLTNANVLDMLDDDLSQEIVMAKIAASACEFDTSPAALKVLKATNVPDAVILAMIQAPTGSRRQELTNAGPSAPARIDCKHTRPVSVYSTPWTRQNYSGPDSVEAFKVKCGDKITLLNPGDKQGWLKIRTADGQVGTSHSCSCPGSDLRSLPKRDTLAPSRRNGKIPKKRGTILRIAGLGFRTNMTQK